MTPATQDFFSLRDISFSMDSKVSTLIHELAHMPEVLGTRGRGEIYFFNNARKLAQTSPEEALRNSDNIASYVLVAE